MRLFEIYENVYDEVYEHAAKLHAGQVRKATGAPYITHPESVAKLVDAFGGDDEQITAAFCHDTLEDCNIDWKDLYKKYGERVSDIVSELTNENDEIERLKTYYKGDKVAAKEQYMNKHLLQLTNDALLIKLCDFLHNVLDKPGVNQKARMIRNLKFLQKHRRLNEVQKEIIDSFMVAAGV